MEVEVKNLWNGEASQEAGVKIRLEKTSSKASGGSGEDWELDVKIEAPFYDDPQPPDATKGEAYYKLWEYEVVELFFYSSKDKLYLEVEFGPHGQHLGLLLKQPVHNCILHSFPIDYEVQINKAKKTWIGHAKLPKDYFPPNVDKFNAYAIHGLDGNRCYKSLFPVPGSSPDFHRLECFQSMPLQLNDEISDMWKNALAKAADP